MSTSLLIIDDDLDLANTLAEVLGGEGYEVSTVSQSSTALEHLHGHAPPDLILLDLMMPQVDGWQVCNQLRAEPDLARIPVILMTAASNLKLPLPEHPRVVVRKPFVLEDLVDQIERLALH